MQKWFLYILLSLAAFEGSGQHSALFSQYMFNGLIINPAYTGSKEVFTTSAMYRNQWAGFDGAPVTQVLSAHTPLRNEKLALGLLLFNDQIGVSKETGIHTNYAYRLQLGRGKLSFGLGAGISFIRHDWNKLDTREANDEVFQDNSQRFNQPDFSAGLYYYSKKYYLGVSAPLFLRKTFDFSEDTYTTANTLDEYNFVITSGFVTQINEEIVLKPSALVRYNPNSDFQLDINATLYLRDRIGVGMSYRIKDALVGIFQYQINRQLNIGYGYDYGLSEIGNYSNGSHELMLQYQFGYRITTSNPRYF